MTPSQPTLTSPAKVQLCCLSHILHIHKNKITLISCITTLLPNNRFDRHHTGCVLQLIVHWSNFISIEFGKISSYFMYPSTRTEHTFLPFTHTLVFSMPTESCPNTTILVRYDTQVLMYCLGLTRSRPIV